MLDLEFGHGGTGYAAIPLRKAAQQHPQGEMASQLKPEFYQLNQHGTINLSANDHGARLKIDVGPGYRVYYSVRGERLLLLLIGGDKSSQQKDIAKAILLAKNFSE